MRIPKLKLKLWQELVFIFLVSIAPIIFIILELVSSQGSVFLISILATICTTFVFSHVVHKYMFARYFANLREKCIMLEHDYMIVENENIERQWGKLNVIIHGFEAIVLLLSAVICISILYPHIADLANLTDSMQSTVFKCTTIIVIMFILGLLWKIVLYIRRWFK